jgi:hypothetical protein
MANLFLYRDDAAIGPFTVDQISAMYASGQIGQNALLSEDGRTWVTYTARFGLGEGTGSHEIDQREAIKRAEKLKERRRQEELPQRGSGRVEFLLFWILGCFIAAFGNQFTAPAGQLAAMLFGVVVLLIGAAGRFANIGYSRFRAFLILVPIFNLYILIQLLFYRANSRRPVAAKES